MQRQYTIEDFLDIKSAVSPSFSPDGNMVAFLSNVTGVFQLYLVPRAGGEPEQLTAYEDAVSVTSFSPVNNEIVFGMAKGGNENTQLFLRDVASKSVRALTSEGAAFHRFGGWSRDGKFITYASNARNGKDVDVYVMEVATGVSRAIYREGGLCGSYGFSPTGNKVTVWKNYGVGRNDLYLVDIASGVAELLTPEDEKGIIGPPRWLPDERGLFFVQNRGRDFCGVSFFDLATKKSSYVLTPEHDVDGIGITRDGEHLMVMVNKDGYGALTLYETKKLEPLEQQNFPKGMIGGATWSPDGSHVAFSLTNGTKNGDVWVWSKEENKYWQITHSPCKVPEEVFVEPELVKYASFDGLQIPAFVYMPKVQMSGQKIPVIVDIHGGPASQACPGFSSVAQYLVHCGYAVVLPNVRGSSGYGKAYMALDDVKKRMDSVADLKYLHEFLLKDGRFDGSKVALMGVSYGGYMVLAGLTFQPELWAAGVDIVGISNFVSFLENTSPYRRANREAEYGSLATDREFLESISPINFINNVQAPLIIVHGANDPRVPLSEAEQMHKKLIEAGKKSELLVYADEGHGLSKLKNRRDAYTKIVKFLDLVLKD